MRIKNKGYCALTVLIAILLVVGMYGITQMCTYKNHINAGYRRAFTELVNYVNDIDVDLSKAAVTTDTSMLSKLSEKIWLYSAFAKENLGQLPVASLNLDKTSDFLSQVGDYTYSIAKKMSQGGSVTDDEYEQLNTLNEYSDILSKELLTMEEGVMNGDIPVSQTDGILNRTVATFGTDMNEIEEKFNEYSSLIYDGPFSNHVENKNGELLKYEVVSKKHAQQVASELLNDNSSPIRFSGESEGNIPTFDFTSTISKERQIYIKIAKNGGYPLFMLDNRLINNPVVEYTVAKDNAHEFLKKIGYVKMKQTGYIVENNAITFAYAFIQNEIIMYPDLIKVKVALDNGEVIGLEASGFLSNHIESRELPKYKLTKEQAVAKLGKKFSIKNINKVLIPLDTGKLVYCYEIKGQIKDKTFLVYMNTETGEEEDIKLFVQTDYGELSV